MKKMTNTSTKQARDINNTGKVDGLKQIKQNWETKRLHAKYPMQNQDADVHKGNTQRHDMVGQYIHWKIHQHYNAPYAKNR